MSTVDSKNDTNDEKKELSTGVGNEEETLKLDILKSGILTLSSIDET